MRRETQNLVLGLLGGALLKISLDGTYLRYVKQSAQPWLICAGITMVGLASLAIIRDIRSAGAKTPDHEGHHHHHGRAVWLLVLPVLTIFLVAPPALGADSVLRSATVSPLGRQTVVKMAFPPLPLGNPLPMRVVDVVTRSAWDATDSLNGRTIQLTGFLVHEGNTTYLARLVVTCCAADAMPVKVKVDGNDFSQFADDQWLSLVGQIRQGSANPADNYIPTMAVANSTPVSMPENPYED